MFARTDRRVAEEAIGRLYRHLGLKPPVIVWCHSPISARTLLTFFQTLSLTQVPRSVLYEKLIERTIDVFVDRVLLPAFNLVERLQHRILCLILEEDYTPFHQSHECSGMLRMRYSAQFQHVWYELPDAIRGEFCVGLHACLHALGIDVRKKKLRGLLDFLESVADSSTAEERHRSAGRVPAPLQPDDNCIVMDHDWYEIQERLRSIMRPARWKSLKGILDRKRRHAVRRVIRHYCGDHPKAREKEHVAEVEQTLMTALDDIGPERIQRRFLLPRETSLMGRYTALRELSEKECNSNFVKMYAFNIWYAFLRSDSGLSPDPFSETLDAVLANSGMVFPHRKFCLISDPPGVCHLDDAWRLHDERGPALTYPQSGLEIYAWHGIEVAPAVILDPEQISLNDITDEYNTERRYVKIARYGIERYLRDRAAEIMHRDASGVLWKIHPDDSGSDTPILMVEVRNASPEPDGSHRHFFLRVPPTMRTAREAVAWTFGKSEDEYSPDPET
ncbi:MAG: hypothetical protein KFH87_09465 [Bacteroidetes bacterium]|nr:hypothetical protein [Bacteroidota bacterium]